LWSPAVPPKRRPYSPLTILLPHASTPQRRHDFSAHLAGSTPRVFARSPVAGSPRYPRSGVRRRRSASTWLTHPLLNGDTTSLPTSPALRRECSRDHQSLDLGGSSEECVDLGVTVPLLDREIPYVAVAAADLYRLLSDLDRDFARLQLGHRTLGHLELALVATLPERSPDQAACRLDLDRHIGELESDRLALDDRPAELLTLLGVVEGELEGG